MVETPIFYRDKPVFGFDLGFNSVKIMQIDTTGKSHRVQGYGFTSFDSKAVKNGVIINPEAIAKETYDLMTKRLIGSIDTKRVCAAIPASRSFNRVLSLPMMQKSELKDAVQLEAEQYIPVPTEDLYIDYQVVESDKEKGMEVLVVAAPRDVINSYATLFDLLGLETSVLETSINASTRLVMHAERTDIPTLIVDFGSVSTDLSIFDSVLRVTGTVGDGGDTMTKAIADELSVTPRQAQTIKTKYGLAPSKRQAEIRKAAEPMLDKMVSEVKKMVRFYQERSGEDKTLEQVIILGGGANMPGMADYLTDKIRLPVRMCNPWLNLNFDGIQPPHESEKTLYATAAGLALVTPKEITT